MGFCCNLLSLSDIASTEADTRLDVEMWNHVALRVAIDCFRADRSISPDGKRALAMAVGSAAASARLNIILNWQSLLKRK